MTQALATTDIIRPNEDAAALQRLASDPNFSVWVGASAGSGKTTVLTSRVVRLLLAGVAPQKILCLTFTRAAAAEMAIRITNRLANWATCDDATLQKELTNLQDSVPEAEQMAAARRLFARVLACPGGMRIQTIHGFAQEILKRFPIEAGLPPHFTILQDFDAEVMQTEAMNDVLQQAARTPESRLGQSLQRLVKHLGEERFITVMRDAAQQRDKLAAHLEKIGGAERLEEKLRQELNIAPDETAEHIRAQVAAEENFPRSKLTHLARCLIDKGSKKYQERGDYIAAWLASSASHRAEKIETYMWGFFTDKGTAYKDIINKDVLKQHPELTEIFNVEVKRLESIKERLDSVRVVEETAALGILAAAINSGYAKRKQQEAVLDYQDLIQRTADLLQRPGIAPWILYKLDGGLDHILVDEAQDTSPLQWDIVRILAEEFFVGESASSNRQRTLFVVGDEKQSIYSFQGADPAAFQPMLEHFRNQITAVTGAFHEVPMNISFRSAPAILRAVDAVFASDKTRQGVARDFVRHTPNRTQASGRVEVWAPLAAIETDKSWQLPLAYRHEADAESQLAVIIAEHIRAWLDAGRMVHGRPVQAGDFMVLLRRRRRFMTQLVRELKQRGVPVAGVDRMVLTEQLPVMDVLALLQFSLLPDDDLNLATVLRGPILGGSEELLMQLAINRSGTLWQSLQQAAKDPACRAIYDYLARCLAHADQMTPFAMIAAILHNACPASTVSGRRAIWQRLGPDALDPLDELLNVAQDYSTRYTPSLQGFLHWVAATETEVKRELAQSTGQVKISTIHAAKGLEAPIVFMPDTVSPPRRNELSHWLWDDEAGLPYYVPREPLHARLRELRAVLRTKQLEEYRRLMYVALTRAADELYICGWHPRKAAAKPNDNVDEDKASNVNWHTLIAEALLPVSQTREALALPDIQVLAVMADPVLPPAEAKSASDSVVQHQPLPAWVYQAVPTEALQPAVLQPSQLVALAPALASPSDQRFARGRIIHRLLQSLPDMPDATREAAAERFLANPQYGLNAEQRAAIRNEVLALLRNPDYAPLFAAGSRAEVPLTGLVEGLPVSGQVDRLVVRQDSVWIIDFKSNRPPPADVTAVPETYRQQMAAYAALLRQIYPERQVRCFLLWTYDLRLMEIDCTT